MHLPEAATLLGDSYAPHSGVRVVYEAWKTHCSEVGCCYWIPDSWDECPAAFRAALINTFVQGTHEIRTCSEAKLYDIFVSNLKRSGYMPGKEWCEESKTHPFYLPFADLQHEAAFLFIYMDRVMRALQMRLLDESNMRTTLVRRLYFGDGVKGPEGGGEEDGDGDGDGDEA